MNLNDGELGWLCQHLGHELKIDKDFYRQHEGVVEVTKVGKMLLAVDAGVVSRFSGKKLSDISLQGLINCFLFMYI